jgi:ribosomal protein L11 methylase PrmA
MSRIPGSFRDPSGFLFFQEETLYRQVNKSYQNHFQKLLDSGLYQKLVEQGWLIPHEDAGLELARSEEAARIIKPRRLPFISYPYEWCFSQLKQAALLTLNIQKTALEFGMTLKDASAYNVQFMGGRPVFIDTLSFETYAEGSPWIAYRQFCQHFLAPLALMTYRDLRLSQLLRIHIDGIPLDLASRLLPRRTALSFSLLSHIHLHARSQAYFAEKKVGSRRLNVSRLALLGIIDNLESVVRKLKRREKTTEWGDYYANTNYTAAGLQHKQELIREYLTAADPTITWDMGANSGLFSRIAADHSSQVISFDLDPEAVERNYAHAAGCREQKILPLILDITNPSPAIGWALSERMSIAQRGPADLVLALALIHHLAIGNNVPLGQVAEFFASIGRQLIIEFIPKSDSQIQRMLASREDVFPGYSQENFERDFSPYFTVVKKNQIRESQRTLYLMERKPI